MPEPVRLKAILKDTIAWFIKEIRESGSMAVLEKDIVEPVLQIILNKLFPYIITSSVVFLVVIATIILIAAWLLPKTISVANKVTLPNM